jgi:predicted Fe-Mo cluster-binding NifX family protein
MAEKTLIAVGVDQNQQVWDEHFGVAPYYHIYNRSGELVEQRLNPYGPAGDKHKHHGNPALIVELLPECGVFIARSMGKKQLLAEKMGVTPFITTETESLAALRAFLDQT